jgi:murein DD-endopeptidase MepM/ murein hydrolase activator NlpD
VKRVERTRIERLRRSVVVVGLSFAAGALVSTALTWRLHEYGAGLFPMHQTQVTGTSGDASEAVVKPTSGQSAGGPGAAPVSGRTATPATAAVTATSAAEADVVADLRGRALEVPVQGVQRRDLHDTYTDARGNRVHDALDIMAARNTPVRAVEDGPVAKLFDSQAGGITLYQYDPTGTLCYYYAHLERYADGITEGRLLHRGEILGYVGSTGNADADAPHLHFAIFRLTPERQWWKGEPINPYPILK